MEPRSLKYIAEATEGELRHDLPERMVMRICVDSRQAQAGDLFFALAGERFDAHNFLPEVAERGVTAVVAERSKIPAGFQGCAVIAVDNTRAALGQIARAVEHLRQAVRLQPNYAEAHENLGVALMQQGKLPEAAACLQKALSLAPDDAAAHHNLGLTFRMLGRLEEGVASLRQAMSAQKGKYMGTGARQPFEAQKNGVTAVGVALGTTGAALVLSPRARASVT